VRHVLLVLAFVALAAPVAATGDRAAPLKPGGKVLAVESTKQTSFAVRLDARTLKPVSKRVSLNGFASAWAYSPDRRLLAVCIQKVGIRILDARRGGSPLFPTGTGDSRCSPGRLHAG